MASDFTSDWPNPFSGPGKAIKIAPTLHSTFNQESGLAQRQMELQTPFDQIGEEYPEHLPDLWLQGREERRKVAALGYNSTGQPRVERTVVTRHPISQHLKKYDSSQMDTYPEILPQEPQQYPWVPQPAGPDATFTQLHPFPAVEDSWWYLPTVSIASSLHTGADLLQHY